jgi:hypothetical protein
MKKIELTEIEFEKIKELISDFNSYYETEDVWDFQDLDNQREIALEIVQILNDKVNL